MPQNASVIGAGVAQYVNQLLTYNNCRDTVTLKVETENGTLKYKKVTIARLSPRQSVVSSTVNGFYVGSPLPGYPTNATREGRIQGKAVIGTLDTNNDYIMQVWDMNSGRDYIYYKVWKGATEKVRCNQVRISSGAYTLPLPH